jgi:hypothetical protein
MVNNNSSEYDSFITASLATENEKLENESNKAKLDEENLANKEAETFSDKKSRQATLSYLEYCGQELSLRKSVADLAHRYALTDNQITKTDLMKGLSKKCFIFMTSWCAFVVLVVIVYIVNVFIANELIKESIIITLLGSTTISVISLVGFIVKGLFGTKEPPPQP